MGSFLAFTDRMKGCGKHHRAVASYLPTKAKTSIPEFDYNFKTKRAKAICIQSINAWGLDLKELLIRLIMTLRK